MKLLIDTDTASDDAVALILAARSDGVTIEAVTTVAGNVPVDRAVRNALITLQLAGRTQVPVFRGCDRPLIRALQTAEQVHGVDGMSETPLPDPETPVADGHAISVLLEEPRRRPGELTLVTLGPLTNLAAALFRDRDLLRSYRHVYCMAGTSDSQGNVSPTAEFNVWADPEAAQVVLSCATPDRVTFIGWDVSRKDAVLTAHDQQRMIEVGTRLAAFSHRVNRQVAQYALEVTGLEGYDLPDPAAMAVALHPELVTASEVAHAEVSRELGTRGQLIVDRRASALPANVTLVHRIDSTAFKEYLFASVSNDTDYGQRHQPRSTELMAALEHQST